MDRHPFAIGRMPSQCVLDGDAIARDNSLHNRKVNFLHRARLELRRQRGLRERRPRDDHHARGFLVEAMDDARTHHTVRLGHRGQLGKSCEQRVNQGRMRTARGGMHRHSGGLVDHDQLAIGEDDLDFGRKLGRRRYRRGGSGRNGDSIAAMNGCGA